MMRGNSEPEREPPSHPSTQRTAGRFTRLVSLEVKHDYFNADAEICRAVEFRPTPQTLRRLKQRGMTVRARGDGFDIFVFHRAQADAPARQPAREGRDGRGASGTDAEPAAPRAPRAGPRGEPPFLFTMALRDLSFAQYTDMPADLLPGDPPLLWSNKDARPTDRRCELIAPDWRATVAGRARAVAAAGGEIEAERNAYARGWKQFGLFDLHLPPSRSGAQASPLRPAPSAASTDPGFVPVAYELRFTARRTVWRYIVAARQGELAADSLDIVDSTAMGGATSRKASFKKLAGRRPLPDGRAAVEFVCRSAMPLRQRAEHRFALRGLPIGGHMRQRTLVDPMPPPSPGSTVFEVAARSTPPPDGSRHTAMPWSDIYVFV